MHNVDRTDNAGSYDLRQRVLHATIIMAKIFDRSSSSDQILINGIRESATEPFSAPGWTDLRIGMYISAVKPPSVSWPTPDPNDDDPTGLAETISHVDNMPSNFMWIGVKDSGLNLPFGGTGSFIGFMNTNVHLDGDSVLYSSNAAIGSDTTYWLPKNSQDVGWTFMAVENNQYRGTYINNQIHLVQDVGTVGFYTGLIGIRLLRPNGTSNTVTIQIPHLNTYQADMQYTNTPDDATLLSQMDPWPVAVQTIGPITFNTLPDSLFAYWPFTLSRLRISNWIVFQKA